MSMFDNLVPFKDHFEEGPDHPFTLLDAKVGNPIETDYGEGTPVLLKIKTEDKPNGEWFSLFGDAIRNQVERMDEGELRGGVECAIVRVDNKAGTQKYKVLATMEQINKDEIPF